MLGFYYYLLTMLDTLTWIFGSMLLMSAISLIPSLIIYHDGYSTNSEKKTAAVFIKIAAVSMAVSTLILLVFPSKRDAIIIGGLVYAEDEIKETGKELKKLPPQLMKLINKELDNLLPKEGESR